MATDLTPVQALHEIRDICETTRGWVATDVLNILARVTPTAVPGTEEVESVTISRELLEALTDPDLCEWDHNHSCQAHGYFYIPQGEMCPMAEARAAITALQGNTTT